MSVDYAAQFDEWARKNRVGVMTTPTPVSTPSVTPSASSIRTGGGADYAALFDDWARRNRPGTTGAGATTPAPSVTIPTTQPASASYAADDAAIGQYGKGNIDLYHRPQYHYNDGAIATVESMSFNENGKEILVPTIAFDNAGKAVKLTDEQAIDRYHRTGEYLGKFNTVAEADSYAEQLHRAQDYYYNGRNATPAAKTAPSLENLSSGYGGYMPSLNPTSKRGNGYMGYGLEVKLPEATENDSSTHAWRGLAKEIGSYVDSVRDTNAAKGIQTAVGNENLGREDNSRYGQYLRLMTPEEREKATRPESQGGLSEKERGAYIRSLNLDERILSGVEKERSEKASQYETRTAEAKKSDSLYGRLIATFVTGDYSYSAKDFQGSDPGPAPEKMRFLTEKQKDTLNAYIKAGDFQAVGDYYKTLEPSLNAQHAQWGTELARDLTANSTLADVVSVPVTGALNSFGGIPGYLATAGHVLRDMATGNYTPIDKNSEAYAIPRLSQALQEGVNERISTIQDPNARYVARLATSGLSSGVSNLIQLYTGQALGLQGDALAQFVTLAMSASAGGQDAYRNLDEGQNNGDAFLNATASAAIEYWTEHMTTSRWIENLGKLKSGKLSKADIVKMLSTQTGAEMWEEVVGNVADQTWDRTWNGENSEFAKRTRDLMNNAGLSREDAETQAFKELYVDQSVEAALSVAFSMILMDGAPAISNHISYVDAGRNLRQAAGQDAVQNEIEKGLLFSSDNPAHTLAEQLQSTQAAGGSQAVTNRDLGRLSFLNGQAVSELLGGIEDGDNEALKYTARAVLEQARDNPSDRVSVTQIRMLRELHEGARDGQARTDTERSERENLFNEFRQDFFSQIERIDLDAAGNPLVSYAEAVNEIRARMPDATDEQIRQFYGQYRDATRTVLFGGHRLTRAQFRSLMQEATPEKLSGVDLDRLFNMAILDTLDGSDAFERYLPGVTEGARQQSDSSRTENFPIEESDIFPESSQNAPQSPETANVDADSVPSEKAIDERVAKPANSTAAAESVTPGLDYEDAVTAEAVNSLNGKTADKIDTLGKLLGKRIRFANSVAEGAANGQISGNDITLERSLLDEGAEQDSLVWKILGHELTHGVQQDAPETYAAFRDAIMSEESFRAHVADIRSAYEMRGLSITEEAALDEAVADYGGDIMRNTDTAERFIERNRQNRTLLQRIRDAIVNLVRKLTGAEKRQVRTVQSLFDTALDAAAQNVREDATQADSAATQDNGDIRFAIKTADSGEKYVRADRQVIFGNNPRSWGEQVENYINGKIRRGQDVLLMTDDGDALLLTKTTAGKLSSRYRGNGTSLSENEYMTKLEAGVHIDELARISQSTHTTADKNSRHGDFASKGWSYRRAFFQDSDGAYYSLDISVAQNDTGNIVYNIGNVKRRNFPTARNASNGSSANSGAQGGEISSANNIPQTAAESNSKPKFSLKGTENSEQLRKLVEENKRLTERVKFWQEQTRLSDPKQPYRAVIGEVNKAAKSILTQFDSALDVQDIRPAVLELVQHLNKGPEGEGAWSSADNDAAEQAAVAEWISQANGMARTLAAQVINHARVLTNDADMKVVRDIREEVRKAPLSYNRAAIAERTSFSEFWKRNRSRLKLQNKNGTSVESHWQEWTQRFGEEWFPSSLSDETEMLLCLDQIMDALDHIQPEYINPHNADMLDAIEKCREVILDIAMDTGPRARTFADRQKAARNEAYQKGVEEGRRRAQAAVESAKKAVEKERQQSRRNMDAYKERVKERNRAREAAQINRQRWVQLNRLMKRLNNRKMLQADRTLLNAIYENLEAIANNTLGITTEDIEANMRELWMKISEYGGTNEDGESIPGRNPMYSERFIRNPKAFAEVLKQRRQSTERMKELERETAELSPEQLQRVCEFLMAFDHAQATIDQLINARDKRDLALQAVLLQEHLRGATPFLANGLITEMLRPVSFATRATGYAQNDPFVNSVRDLVEGERIRDDYKRRAYALILNRFAVNLGNSPSVTKRMSAAEQRQLVQRIKTLMKTFSGKDAAAEQNLIEIHGTDPGADAFSDKPVTAHITKGMRMGLYLHSKNDDNMRHITQGGFKVPSVEKGGYEFYRKENYAEAYANNHAVRIRLTKSEVARIVSEMSAEEKAFADAVSYYYDTMSKKELTRVHEMLKGWSPFNVENYMPIETDDAFNHVDYETMQTDGTMSTPGFSLERVKSGKAVILRDLNLTAFNSVEQHAKFVGLAIPVRNVNKLLNWSRVTRGSVEQAVERMYGKESADRVRAKFAQSPESGETALALPREQAQFETDNTLSILREVLGWKKTKSLQDFLNENAKYESVRETIRASLGEAGTKYIEKLMKDMTGQKKSPDRIGRVLSELSSNLAGAALTLNGSTAAVQTASFPTAAAAIGWSPLWKALHESATGKRVNLKIVNVYTSRLWERSQGFTTHEAETKFSIPLTLSRA